MTQWKRETGPAGAACRVLAVPEGYTNLAMTQSIRDGTARRTKHLETFIDAVLAIAITLPIVELRLPTVPTGGDLAGAYRQLDVEYLMVVR